MSDARELWLSAQRTRAGWEWRSRNIMENIRMIVMFDRYKRAGLPSMVTNDPATLFWLSVAILSGGKAHDRIDIGGQGNDVLTQAGRAERLTHSLWTQRDRNAHIDGDEEWKRALAFWMALSGYYYVTDYLDADDDAAAVAVSDVWSPLEAFHEPGSEALGPRKVVRLYTVTLGEAIDISERYGGDRLTGDHTGRVSVANVWERDGGEVHNAIVAELPGRGYVYLKPIQATGRRRIPIHAGPVGGRPQDGFNASNSPWSTTDTSLLPGQSILDANKPIYRKLNELLSNYLEVAKDYASAPWLARGLGFDVEPDQLGKSGSEDNGLWGDTGVASADTQQGTDRSLRGHVIETPNPQASLTRVDPGRSPVEIRDFIEIFERMAQRGGLPYILFTQGGGDLSGFAISQLLTAARHKLDPYLKKMSFLRAMVSETWLREFRDGEFGAVLVAASQRSRGAGLAEEVEPADIPARFVVTSEVLPELPSDLAERITLARQSIPGGPLMAMRTMQETLLPDLIEDPDLDNQWRADDVMEANPLVQAYKTMARARKRAAELREQKNTEGAELLDSLADFVEQNLGQAIGAANGGSPPASRTQLPNRTLPTEAQGMSEDRVRSMMGVGPGTPANG